MEPSSFSIVMDFNIFKRRLKNKIPKYRVGDMVKVLSKEEISQKLNDYSKQDSCLFMNQMWEYCGKEFKIAKVVKNLFDEQHCKMYNTSFHLYILNGVICRGEVESFDHRCDHSCHFLWHEDWLTKA